MKTTYCVRIPRDPDEVYAYLADVRKEVHWRQSITGSRYVDADAPDAGVLGETDVQMGRRALTMRRVVIRADPDARDVAWMLDGDPWHGGGSYVVEPDGAASLVTASLEVRLRGANRALEPILGFTLRSGLRTDLARLADVLSASD